LPAGVFPTASMVVMLLPATALTGVATNGWAVRPKVHRAGTTGGDSAAELGARHADDIAQHQRTGMSAGTSTWRRCPLTV